MTATTACDAVVIGAGGVGAAALFHLARRGARVVGLDRFPAGHAWGSSHGHTRIIRQAYFEHPDYVPLALRSYDLWDELQELEGEPLRFETGLLQIGPAGGEVLMGVRNSARRHGLEIEELSAADIARGFRGFRVPQGAAGAYERRAGYVRVEACVRAHLRQAATFGADLRLDEPALDWRPERSGVRVRTERHEFSAGRLIVAAGAWSASLLGGLGVELTVRRKSQFWFRAEETWRVDRGQPAFLYELPERVFYGFPNIDDRGVKIAEHTGGQVVADPLKVDRDLNAEDRRRVESFAGAQLEGVSSELLSHSVCLYTLSPDSHFLLDRHPQHPQVCFAAGLSGHGFKFTPVLGQALAELSLEGHSSAPVGFLGLGRLKT